MNFLWDTDVCVFFLKGHAGLREKVLSHDDANIYITMITIAELRYGAYCSAKANDNLRRIEILASRIPVLGTVTDITASIFGEKKAQLRKQGRTIGDFDLLIAALALEHDCVVVTNNLAHFSLIPDLKVENWI